MSYPVFICVYPWLKLVFAATCQAVSRSLFNPAPPEAKLTSGFHIPKGYQWRSPCLVRGGRESCRRYPKWRR
jgi:hypothetical protein